MQGEAGRRAVVVTGVSSGIGQAVAEHLIRRGFEVFGSVRKAADAERLAQALGQPFTPLRFDVVDQAAVAVVAGLVRERLGDRPLFGLVNNAGMPSGGPLMHQPPEEFMQVLRVNTVGPLIVSQAFLPLLGARRGFGGRPGRIVNISSVGGRLVAPFAGAYQASKHALEALSDGLRRELLLYGVDVVVIEPGAVVTAIWDRAEEIDATRYAATDYAEPLQRFQKWFFTHGRQGLPASRIAEVVHDALTVARPRARYVVVKDRFVNWTLPRALPDRWLDRLMARGLGLRRLPAGKTKS
jgi:NAD(P)-dependent dehydrogenase (short-subunit alcohol dehydrogenase family)